MLGGQGDYITTLAAYLYVISPLYLALILLNVLTLGILTGYDPELAHAWRFGPVGEVEQEIAQLTESAPDTAFAVSIAWLLQTLLLYLWFAVCWGTFRELHGLSKARSFFAYLLAGSLFYLALWGSWYVIRGLYGSGQPEITAVFEASLSLA